MWKNAFLDGFIVEKVFLKLQLDNFAKENNEKFLN